MPHKGKVKGESKATQEGKGIEQEEGKAWGPKDRERKEKRSSPTLRTVVSQFPEIYWVQFRGSLLLPTFLTRFVSST